MKDRPNFTKKQREYILKRDEYRCQFHTYDQTKGKWVRCSHTTHLEVHHILPRGFAYQHLPKDFIENELNGRGNLITLCASHHRGYNWDGDCVHPDTRVALKHYREGDKEAFHKMTADRAKMNASGKPYWVTVWDWMFQRIVRKMNSKFTEEYPNGKK